MEHTLGPWIVSGQCWGRYITVKGANGRTVARVPWGTDREAAAGIATDDGDARLIAAAPEMLEALRCVLGDGHVISPETWHLVKSIVVKAEG